MTGAICGNIARGIAEAFYGEVLAALSGKVKILLPEDFKMIITTFYYTFINHRPWQ